MKTRHTLDFGGCAGGVENLGPGRRAVIWVRGCSLACPGCMTPELWASGSAGSLLSIEAVAAQLRPLLAGSDGLTISGGEPMEQPAALSALVQLLRATQPDLEVLVYSGYSYEHLQTREAAVQEFLQQIDILIDQPFDQAAPNTLKWRGSDNQRVHFLSPSAYKHATVDETMPETRQMHIQMLENGQFRIIGIPRRGDMQRYRKLMEQRGIKVRKDWGKPSVVKDDLAS